MTTHSRSREPPLGLVLGLRFTYFGLPHCEHSQTRPTRWIGSAFLPSVTLHVHAHVQRVPGKAYARITAAFPLPAKQGHNTAFLDSVLVLRLCSISWQKKKRKQRYSVICHAATHKASGRRRSKSVRAPEVKNAVFPSLKQPQPASCLKGSRETVLGSDCFNAAPTPFFRSPHPVKLVPIALPPPDIIYMLSFFFFAIAPINTHTRPKPLTRSVTIEPLCPSHIYISSWSH